MRKANVYCNGVLAGELTETPDRKYLFRYEDDYFKDSAKPAVSLTLPKNEQEYYSDSLFPFFFNMHLIDYEFLLLHEGRLLL